MKNLRLQAKLVTIVCLATTLLPLSLASSNWIFGNGVNLQPSYYNGGDVDFGWDFMKQNSKIQTVRIEIEPDALGQAKNWISQANNNGYHVIATYHNYQLLGSDDPNELINAANWWQSNYWRPLLLLVSFTINLMNEWGDHGCFL